MPRVLSTGILKQIELRFKNGQSPSEEDLREPSRMGRWDYLCNSAKWLEIQKKHLAQQSQGNASASQKQGTSATMKPGRSNTSSDTPAQASPSDPSSHYASRDQIYPKRPKSAPGTNPVKR